MLFRSQKQQTNKQKKLHELESWLCSSRGPEFNSQQPHVTPQGEVFHQKKAAELSAEEDLIFLCGHYEGVDERVLEEIVTDYISIGDYVLTGGELPAMVMIDAIARLVLR